MIADTETKVEFFHECTPPRSTAQQRQHFGKGKSALTPSAAKASATWRAIVETHAPGEPMTGQIALTAIVTWPGSAKPRKKPTRPDLDNVAKLLLDAMTKAGYWHDDAQVVELSLAKYTGPIAGVYILAMEVDK